LSLTTNSIYRVDIYLGTTKVTSRDWAILQPVK
jgi:hypothetical protein